MAYSDSSNSIMVHCGLSIGLYQMQRIKCRTVLGPYVRKELKKNMYFWDISTIDPNQIQIGNSLKGDVGSLEVCQLA